MDTNFASRKQEIVFESSQKHFCFTDANFASETYVSQFSHGGNNFTSLATRAAKTFLMLSASLATQETLQETMFPSLAKPFRVRHSY